MINSYEFHRPFLPWTETSQAENIIDLLSTRILLRRQPDTQKQPEPQIQPETQNQPDTQNQPEKPNQPEENHLCISEREEVLKQNLMAIFFCC